MAANGISTLPTKEDRLKAKLDLAQSKRIVSGIVRAYYDLELLPMQYSGNNVIDNENIGGLVIGRPWTETIPEVFEPNLLQI